MFWVVKAAPGRRWVDGWPAQPGGGARRGKSGQAGHESASGTKDTQESAFALCRRESESRRAVLKGVGVEVKSGDAASGSLLGAIN